MCNKKGFDDLSAKLEFIKAFLFLMGFRRTEQKSRAWSGLGIRLMIQDKK